MEPVSSQLVMEIEERVSPFLKEYFEATKQAYDYGYDNLTDYIRGIIMENDMCAEDNTECRIKYNNEMASRRVRRNDWLRRMKENKKKYPYRSEKSYFHHIYQQVGSASGNRYLHDTYNTMEIGKISDIIISETEEWKKSGRGFLVECPNFPHIGRINVPMVFQSDLFCDICTIVRDCFDWNLKNAMFATTLDMIINPVFSSSRGKANVTLSADKKAIAEIFKDEHYTLSFFDIPETAGEEFQSSGTISIPCLDDLDMSIISFLINNAKIDLSAPSSVLAPTQTTSLGSICASIYPGKNPSALQRENIRKRLLRLSYPIQAKGDKGTLFSWVILSSVALHKDPENNSTLVDYTLGNILTRALVENRLLKIPALKMEALTGAGRTLLVQLQLDRITRSFTGEYEVQYTYARMVQIMLLRSKSVQRNLEKIEDALEDIKINLHQKVVKDYTVRGRTITVQFCPMSKEEQMEIVDNENFYGALEDKKRAADGIVPVQATHN